MGRTFWLRVAQESEDRLRELSKELLYVAQQNVPKDVRVEGNFVPHITLASIPNSVQIDQKVMDALIEDLEFGAFTLVLETPTKGEDYYQCVLAPVALPAPTLSSLRTRTMKLLEQKDNAYFPHLSLIYGDIDEEWRTRIASKAARSLQTGFEVTIEAIEEWSCTGPVEQWRSLKQWSLQKKAKLLAFGSESLKHT